MPSEGPLSGRSVIVVGAGSAGLTDAVELYNNGAQIAVLEAHDRAGGRVGTRCEVFEEGQSAEAGGDLIGSDQDVICRLAKDLGLILSPILEGRFPFVNQGLAAPLFAPVKAVAGILVKVM